MSRHYAKLTRQGPQLPDRDLVKNNDVGKLLAWGSRKYIQLFVQMPLVMIYRLIIY